MIAFSLSCGIGEVDIIDGCFVKNSKIICYGAYNRSNKDSMLCIPKEEQCFDSLLRCKEKGSEQCDLKSYHRYIYRLLSVDSVRIATSEELGFHTCSFELRFFQ